jgi:hypothetical protein
MHRDGYSGEAEKLLNIADAAVQTVRRTVVQRVR